MDEQQQTPVYQKRTLTITQETPSHTISTVEWGLVIGALGVVDLAQIILDLFVVGVVANRLIDVVVGAFLALYKQLRCKNITGGKWVMALIGTFIGEEIPIADAFPLWTADGIYMMTLERVGEKAKQVSAQVAVVQKVTEKLKKAP